MLTLFAQYYIPKTAKRQAEIDKCFHSNIANPLISRFVILFEREEHMGLFPNNPKITKKFHPDRMTYGHWLKETQLLSPGNLSLLVNSDIYLTESIQHLIDSRPQMQEGKNFLALTRYNPSDTGFDLNSNPHWCQDTWGVVRGEENFPSALLQEAAFELGQPACDNKIAYVMHSYGYSVTNPCERVVSVHLQADTERSYDAKGSKLLGMHAFVYPTPTATDTAVLEFDLLTRSKTDPLKIRLNNWINERKSFELHAEPKHIEHLKRTEATPTTQPQKPAEVTAQNKASGPVAQAATPKPYTPQPNDPNDEEGAVVKIKDFKTGNYQLEVEFNKRFAIYSSPKSYFYYDRYWPVVKRVDKAKHTKGNLKADNAQLFCQAFVPSVLELDTVKVGEDLLHPEHVMFWQYPCRTEGDAYDVHKRLPSPTIQGKVVHTYLPVPWATFIDKKVYPEGFLGAYAHRVNGMRQQLKKMGYQLRVHSVCQHIRWRNLEEHAPKVGITDLWISHKEKSLDFLGDVKLHAWTLYAVNYRDPKRSAGLEVKKISDKKTFASFVGAHMKHYLSTVRLDLAQLKDLPNYHVEIKDLWHFNKVVYNYQVKADDKAKDSDNKDETLSYNKMLSDTVFSLCPVGAGPNSLRLWESMAVGSIPVIFSDRQEMPQIPVKSNSEKHNWEDGVIFHNESEVDTLDRRLKAMTQDELEKRQLKCIEFYKLIESINCF